MNIEDITRVTKNIIKPVDPLNIYINIFDLFKMQKMKSITGDNFVVSNGILQCQNYFIPLDSISIVEMARIQLSPWWFLCLFIFGMILSVFNIFLYNEYYIRFSFAIPMFVLGFILSSIVIFINTKLPYTMTIRLNNNIFCTYMNSNKEFIQNIMDKMQECINNRKGEYNFMLNQGRIEYNDNHSINISGGIKDSKVDIVAHGGRKDIHKLKGKNINQSTEIEVTAEDWAKLEDFFSMRQKEFPMGDRNYKICGNLATYSQRRDEGGLNKYLRTIGSEALKNILSSGTSTITIAAIKSILQKVISKK